MNMEKLTIGVHAVEKESFAVRWVEMLSTRGVDVKRLDLLGSAPLEQVRGCDGVMWHWFHYPHEVRLAALPILRVIEEQMNIPVFPDMATAWHYDDKIAQAYLLPTLGIPHPKTWVFWRKADAMAWCAQQAEYPLVAKLAVGAGSENVRMLRDIAQARRYIERCFSGCGIVVLPSWPKTWGARWRARIRRAAARVGRAIPYVLCNRFPSLPDRTYWMPQKNYALFQEFLPGNEFDTRVTVIGDRAFAFRRFNRPNDFRASGSGRIDWDPAGIDLRCVEAAFSAVAKLKSQSMAFDFMFRGAAREPVVGEISYCYADWAVEKCPGHWDAGMNWHEGRLWPEEAHVEDFLHRVQAKRECGSGKRGGG